MAPPRLPKSVIRRINELVQHFEANKGLFTHVLEQLRVLFSDCKDLAPYVHSMKWRVKDPSHLRDKLIRKAFEASEAGERFNITKQNLFERINDLAGFRILHLHTRQMKNINEAILACLNEARYPLAEGPTAKTWDDETQEYFQAIGIATEQSETLYTSVHYVIASNSRTHYTCELQVRTLADEVWGEVDHTINYPHPSSSVECREQIKVLARVTSSCSRLVDSIFMSHGEHRTRTAAEQRAAARRRTRRVRRR